MSIEFWFLFAACALVAASVIVSYVATYGPAVRNAWHSLKDRTFVLDDRVILATAPERSRSIRRPD